jgi:3-hydroxyisobutyrate dehydrogenase-like beta-hydroxyacid dehydrogenase
VRLVARLSGQQDVCVEQPDAVGPIGVVGLGVMGSAVANLLITGGAQVWGHDISAQRQESFVASGGHGARSARDVAEHTAVVLTSLPTAGALAAVVSGPDGLRSASVSKARLVIEMSTLSLVDKQAAADALAPGGVAVADVPLSGTGAQARSGDLVACVSADDDAARALALAVTRRFTRSQYDVGAFGNGSRFKYVANLLVAVHNVAAAEALVLAERAGLDLDRVLAAVGDGAGGSRMLGVRGPLMALREYADASVRLEVFLKDVELIRNFAADVGAPAPLLEASRAIYLAARADGRSDQDTACVAEVLRARSRLSREGREEP